MSTQTSTPKIHTHTNVHTIGLHLSAWLHVESISMGTAIFL